MFSLEWVQFLLLPSRGWLPAKALLAAAGLGALTDTVSGNDPPGSAPRHGSATLGADNWKCCESIYQGLFLFGSCAVSALR